MMILPPHNAENWAKHTFGTADLGDKRRTERLVDIAGRLAQYSGQSAAIACKGEDALVEGTYRFIRNEQIQASAIREAGFEQTVKSAQGIAEIFALEDTTSLSYKHQVAATLGKLGKVTDKARGWWVHSVLLLNGQTQQSIGLVEQQWWCRADDVSETQGKESRKWQTALETCRERLGDLMPQVIAVCDREADIFDCLDDKQGHGERFVVRAKHLRMVEESAQDLLSHLKNQPVNGCYQITIEQKGMIDKSGNRFNRPARQASLEVRSATVTFTRKSTSFAINVVLAEEVGLVEGETPLRWLLLTSEPVETLEQALRVIHIYAARWRVEDFHKAWKTGAGAERQRMTDKDNLERMVSILAFVAVRLMQLRESFTLPLFLKAQGLLDEAEHVANLPCDTVLSTEEWQLLSPPDKEKGNTDKDAPSLQWAYHAIARLGGFTDTKRTGIASWATIWKGWERLQERLIGFNTAKKMSLARFDFS